MTQNNDRPEAARHLDTVPGGSATLPEVELFLALFSRLRSDVFERDPFRTLNAAETDEVDYDVLACMESIVNEWQAKKAKAP